MGQGEVLITRVQKFRIILMTEWWQQVEIVSLWERVLWTFFTKYVHFYASKNQSLNCSSLTRQKYCTSSPLLLSRYSLVGHPTCEVKLFSYLSFEQNWWLSAWRSWKLQSIVIYLPVVHIRFTSSEHIHSLLKTLNPGTWLSLSISLFYPVFHLSLTPCIEFFLLLRDNFSTLVSKSYHHSDQESLSLLAMAVDHGSSWWGHAGCEYNHAPLAPIKMHILPCTPSTTLCPLWQLW